MCPGEMERLQKFWLAGVCKKSENRKGEKSVPLEILNFTSAFILLACGMVLVGFLLAVEHFYFKFFRRKLRKWDHHGCCSLVSLVRFSVVPNWHAILLYINLTNLAKYATVDEDLSSTFILSKLVKGN